MKKKSIWDSSNSSIFYTLKKRFKSFLFYYFFHVEFMVVFVLFIVVYPNKHHKFNNKNVSILNIYFYLLSWKKSTRKKKKISVKMLSVLIIKNKNLIVDITVSTTIKIVFNYLENNFILAVVSPLLSVLND